ncbi:MAG TPA: glycosyltransferase family 39 protein, partial [Thermoanaerobaculia bacterium]|nr:glycosyltransferase family 39 protein [Thermoanaerobaculia bacterium]
MTAPDVPAPPPSGIRRALPAAFALVSLLLAGGGEAVIRSGNASGLGLALYLAAITLFAWKAWPPLAAAAAAPAPPATRRSLRLALLLGGVLGAALLTGVELKLLGRGDLKGAETPWAAALLLLLLAAAASGPVTAFAPRWELPPLTGRLRKGLFAAAVVGILALAAATRLPALDRIPYGINADEGDQALVAIQLLRGTREENLFGVGWYHIGMMYFRSLAAVMQYSGISVGGARVFGALCGIATVAIVLVLGIRNFGRRAGLLAGTLAATIGPALQFSRETTCAGPTITLWTAAAAFFLEAARTGRAWAWALACATGGVSIYFYPTGRLWGVVGALFTLGFVARGPRGRRGRLVAGTALAAAAAFVVMTPFLQMVAVNPDLLVVRARETSIFVKRNPLRLGYYDPSWSTAKLVAVQLERSVGILNRYPDGNFFWPTRKPILPPALAALTLLGLGASLLKVRDVRFLLLSAWFWVGFVGVVVTVETPNLHRMATAVPVLALFAGLVLDDVARRAGDLAAGSSPRLRRRVAGAAAGLAGLVAA